MAQRLSMVEARGVPLHAIVLSPRITPNRQTIVRPSPDLAYSICRYDLNRARNGIRVSAAGWRTLASVSVFDAATSNIAAVPMGPGGASLVIAPSGPSTPGAGRSPTTTGLALIRRLAPTAEDHVRVRTIAASDRCKIP